MKDYPAQSGGSARFEMKDVCLIAQDRLISSPAMRQQGNEVAHRAAHYQECRLLAGHLCRQCLQAVHRGILAHHIISQLCPVHGLAHRRAGQSHGVAA